MILCHTHNLIFIKTHKTAGSSVEVALESICGPQDVVTPMKTDDGGETKSRNYHGPSRMSTLYARDKFVRKLISRTSRLVAPGSGRIRPTIQPPGSLGSSWQSFLPCDQIVVPEASALVPRTTPDVEPTSTKREPLLAGSSPRPQSRMDEQTDGSSGGFGGPPHQS